MNARWQLLLRKDPVIVKIVYSVMLLGIRKTNDEVLSCICFTTGGVAVMIVNEIRSSFTQSVDSGNVQIRRLASFVLSVLFCFILQEDSFEEFHHTSFILLLLFYFKVRGRVDICILSSQGHTHTHSRSPYN